MKYIFFNFIFTIISKTWRIRFEGDIPSTPKIIAFWHNEMLAAWRYFSGKQYNAVVSLSKDGEILSRLLASWKYKLIRGSSSRKGNEVLAEMVSAAKTTSVLLTPDGPRGPRHKMKAGAFVAGQRAQVPIFFLRCNSSQNKIFPKSWDKFEFPFPFAKITISVIDKVFIPLEMSKSEINEIILQTEEKMTVIE